ncbi:hypothetical protein J056_001593 [Wallemia ichthyophaga EXF-994]|uniref:Uncharacterized protein n=1 Tax=Wallemia ichthyophaga (strain EXF-994 / CBS 113033) TaxID=1299270 RepID=R9AC88_WALI9|nr:uncharacterized protein J056_001593 [Wallemia ichthyophaga EXF-994]EOQ99761.1 hypothetical protein J056_001593 [Wallemia ichthyophaga EXF-994]TIA82765.1 hypothetical protein E3P98_01148 [Wallemia ichthyophaga]TIB33999.1 hypothetical protein E3P85_01060 [Wallemia ichthyophaga]
MADIERPSRDGLIDFIVPVQVAIYVICVLLRYVGYSPTALFATLVATGFALFYRQVKSAYLNNSLNYIIGSQGTLNWDGQVVFITGGSNGLGKALVKDLLLMRPKRIINVDIADNDITHDTLQTIKCDITNSEQLQRVCGEVIKEHGTPNIVVLNAGAFDAKSLTESTTADFRNTLDVNFTSHLEILNAFLPGFIERNRGHIVSIGSILGELHAAHAATYCATKAAVISLFQCLRVDLKHLHKAPDVKTTLVFPGLIETRLFGNVKYSQSSRLPAWISDAVMPSVNPTNLAQRIVGDLNMRRTGDIRSPYFVHLASWYNHLPPFVMNALEYVGISFMLNNTKES